MVETTTAPKKKTNPLVFVGIGCLVLLVVLGIVSTLVMKFFAKKVGVGLLEGAIESKTGIKTNLQDAENGKMSFTDKKTGQTVDVGSGKIPDSFPKDFPIYPGSKVVSAMSGAQQGKSNGFWVTLSTADSVDKVTAYYKATLASGGWTEGATYSAGGVSSQSVTKGDWAAQLSVTQSSDDNKETSIVIVLNSETATPAGE